MGKKKIWLGEPPEVCDICSMPIKIDFIDGRTDSGHWATMCPLCFAKHGVGFGTGRGQHYLHDHVSGKWVKING